MATKSVKRKWNWVDDTGSGNGQTAELGCLKLDIWHDTDTEWYSAFDVQNGHDATSTQYPKKQKTMKAAKNAVEKVAEKWICDLQDALNGKSPKKSKKSA